MKGAWLSVVVMLALGLAACPEPAPRVSALGRRICLMEAADTALPSGRAAYQQACYASIDQRLANQAAASSGRSFDREGYQGCLRYQDRVLQAAAQRAVALDAWLEASQASGANSDRARRALRQHDRAMADLERWIPSHLRRGLPLEPDAIRVFSRCDPQDF